MSGEVSKKVLWVFVFLILAAIAVIGVMFIRTFQSGRQVTSIEGTPEPIATTASNDLQIIINEPNSDVATSSARITISGTTAADAIVTIGGGAEDQIVTAQSDGSFHSTVALNEGLNVLNIVAFTEDGESTQTKRHIVYTKGSI